MEWCNVICKHKIQCSKNNYGIINIVIIFAHEREELVWITTSNSKGIDNLEEGFKYKIKYKRNGKYISYVKCI